MNMETMNNQIIQEKISALIEIETDIHFLTKFKKRLNPNRSYAQEILKTVNEEMSILGFHREMLFTESEGILDTNPSLFDEGMIEMLEQHRKNRYVPMKPPVKNISRSLGQKAIGSVQKPNQMLATGSESLV
jgi:hypothetical protein